MSNVPNKCSCHASFATTKLLKEHLDDLQAQEQYHSNQAKRCQTHTRADPRNDDDDDDDDDENDDDESDDDDDDDDDRTCPHIDCIRAGETKKKVSQTKKMRPQTMQSQLVHFTRHVECYEVCVICVTETFTKVSKFLRHVAEKHKNQAVGRHSKFMIDTCVELEKKAKIEFKKARAKRKSRKRAQAQADFDGEIPNAKRAKEGELLTRPLKS